MKTSYNKISDFQDLPIWNSKIRLRALSKQLPQIKVRRQNPEPLIGFASADDPIFNEMKEIIGPYNLHPKEIFPEVKTVVSFFLPFEEKLVKLNSKSEEPVKEWIKAKGETDRLIAKINEGLKAELAREDIEAAVPEIFFDYGNRGFDVAWSHKSAAYDAGLGAFGVHHMSITKAGCAGRFGTLLISVEIPPTPRPKNEFCRYKKGEKCLVCADRCPALLSLAE